MPTATALDLARNHYRSGITLRDKTEKLAARIWRRELDLRNLDASWQTRLRPQLLAAVMVAQSKAAEGADEYTAAILAAQGLDPSSDFEVSPAGFVGEASDGRPLDSLLYSSVTTTKTAIGQGATNAEAIANGLGNLQMLVGSQVADAGRVADGVSLAAHKAATGYTRILTPPSCPRCAILAGKWFRWNEGFQRHPRCDCRHVPSVYAQGKSHFTDPREAIEAGKVKGLTRSELQAIRDGADPAAVVNARRGMYEARGRKLTHEARRRFGRGGVRPRPEQIYRDAKSREEALELLERFGYIRDRSLIPSLPRPVPVAPVRIPTQRSPIDELPRITNPRATLRDEARLANPHYAEDHAYGVNCTHVAQAVELRARGFDVQATRLPDGFYAGIVGNGRQSRDVLNAIWETPDGTPAGNRLRHVIGGNIRGTESLVKSWPEGARGMVVVSWKGSGSGHIFNVEKRAGKAVFIEGQTSYADAAAADARRHLGRASHVWVARTDDLILRNVDISEFVVPAGSPIEPPSPRKQYDQAVAKVQAEVKDIYRRRREVRDMRPTNSTESHERQQRMQELADEIQRRLDELAKIKASFERRRA